MASESLGCARQAKGEYTVRIRKILIPLDTSFFGDLLLPAVCKLYAPGEAALTLLSVVPQLHPAPIMSAAYTQDSPPLEQEAWGRQRKLAEEALQSEAQRLQAAGYQVTLLVREGDPIQEIVTCLEKEEYDLVVMATHGSTGLDHQLMGSVVEGVLRQVRIPLLLLRPIVLPETATTHDERSLTAPAAGHVMTIATASDGSTHAQQARALAQELAHAFHAQLQVLVVADEHEDAASAQHLMLDVQRRLGGYSPAVKLIPLVGRPEIVLEQHLSEHPVDLVVLGAFKDRGTGARANIGLSAQRVVQSIPFSVLVAKGHPRKLRKLLVFVDRDDKAIIEIVAQWASVLNADLQFLQILPSLQERLEPVLPRLADLPLNEILAQGLFRRAKSRHADKIVTVSLEEALSADGPDARLIQPTLSHMAGVGLERQLLLLRRGPTVETILYVAEQEDADLIVIGSRLKPAFFPDSAAGAVVELAQCSVLVIRPKIRIPPANRRP